MKTKQVGIKCDHCNGGHRVTVELDDTVGREESRFVCRYCNRDIHFKSQGRYYRVIEVERYEASRPAPAPAPTNPAAPPLADPDDGPPAPAPAKPISSPHAGDRPGRDSRADGRAAPSAPAPRAEDLAKLVERVAAQVVEQVAAQITAQVETLRPPPPRPDREQLLEGLLKRLPDLFDVVDQVHDGYKSTRGLTEQQLADRLAVLDVLTTVRDRIGHWLESVGIERFPAENAYRPAFDRDLHICAKTKEVPEITNGPVVLDVYGPGYRWQGELLRKARVERGIAVGPSPSPSPSPSTLGPAPVPPDVPPEGPVDADHPA